uniref:Uncharacterized protein n=1 Tax=Meloidogyne javanica TaxID=6303 RepID=A0A915MNK1_MELJA
MAYQGLMMRNPQYFAAASGFSSSPTTCSSAASLHTGNIGGGPSFVYTTNTSSDFAMLHAVSSVADILILWGSQPR